MFLAFCLFIFFASCGGGGGGGGGLAAPTGVTATPENGQVIIAWTAVTGATSYNIYWSTTPDVTLSNGTKIADAANPYTQTGLTNGTTYYYVVTAVNSNSESGTSTEVSGMPEDTSHAVALDDTFGTDGIAITPIGALWDRAYGIAIQGDGKIVAAGYSDNGSDTDVAVVRYNTDGSLDTDFDSDGMVMTPVGTSYDGARAIAIQGDGKIVVAGYSGKGSGTDFTVVRYNTDGSLDTAFDADGIVTTPVGTSDDEAHAIAIQGDGKIVVAGYSDNGSDTDIAVVRYNTDGSLDTAFDTDGIVTTPVGSSDDEAHGIAIQGDGKIVVVGYAGSDRFLTMVRYNADGSLDTTFDADGVVETTIASPDPSIAIQADGKIIVAGSAPGVTSVNIFLVCFNTDGTLDTTFGSGGIALTPTGGIEGEAGGIVIQEDGMIVVGGTYAVSKDEAYIVLARYTSDGSLDTSFDSDGMVIGPDGYFTSDIALQSDGKIVLGGYTNSPIDFFLMRYE